MSHPAPFMPALSRDLTGPKAPDRCQSCGAESDPAQLQRWREHDERDQRTEVVVVLCEACAAGLIDPHPRLYGRMSPDEPHPGSMPVCVRCRFREGVDCGSALLKSKGGPGLPLRFPRPNVFHVDYRDKRGRRRGHWVTEYRGSVVCDGREPIPSSPEVSE